MIVFGVNHIVFYYVLQFIEHSKLNEVLVFVDEPEPEPIEVVVDFVQDILGGASLGKGLFLGNEMILRLQTCQITAYFSADLVHDLRSAGAASRNGSQNGEVRPVILSELILQNRPALKQEKGIVADDGVKHLAHSIGLSVHEKRDVFGDAPCESPQRQQIVIAVFGVIVPQYLPKHRQAEWTQGELLRLASIQGFLCLQEYFVHYGMDASADNQIEF